MSNLRELLKKRERYENGENSIAFCFMPIHDWRPNIK
jgi:hypothetical protein